MNLVFNMNNIQNVLDTLKEFANKNSLQVFIPSLGREVGFRPITGSQQKRIYDSGFDNLVFRTKFIVAIYEILAENCLEPDITNNLNVLDKTAILLAYRKALYGPIVKSEQGDVDISQCVNKVNSIMVPNEIFELDTVKIEVKVPIIFDQYKHEKELRYQQAIEKFDPKSFVEAFGEMYIGEACKCVNEIYIEGIPINFKQFNVTEQISIIETLPVQIISKIGTFVKNLINVQTEILTVNAIKDGVETEIVLDINTEFLVEI